MSITRQRSNNQAVDIQSNSRYVLLAHFTTSFLSIQ